MNFDRLIKILGIIGAIVAFLWAAYQYLENQHNQLENRRIEATRPFLERQLKLYTEASIAASTLATSDDEEELNDATKRFWSLYWGELALVEDTAVEEAMVKMGKGIKNKADQTQLQNLSLDLAHACRNSLAISWGVKEWRSPTP